MSDWVENVFRHFISKGRKWVIREWSMHFYETPALLHIFVNGGLLFKHKYIYMVDYVTSKHVINLWTQARMRITISHFLDAKQFITRKLNQSINWNLKLNCMRHAHMYKIDLLFWHIFCERQINELAGACRQPHNLFSDLLSYFLG